MDAAIIQRFYKLYEQSEPTDIMPVSIHTLGNYNIATFPKLPDLLIKGELQNRSLEKGDVILFTAVGAGMNINVMAYRTK